MTDTAAMPAAADTATAPALQFLAEEMAKVIGLESAPVAVFLLAPDADMAPFAGWEAVKRHRYCQALMKARSGEHVILEADELACPAAAKAFGFRPLTPALQTGKGLVGFGIVAEPESGAAMFRGMSCLEPGTVARLALCPLSEAPALPDVVVVEGPPEQLMWLLLAEVNLRGGERLLGSTAVLQATCVDATIIPHLEQRLNFTMGCYGCREATDLEPAETVVGFPGGRLAQLVDSLAFLSEKAVPRSRAKHAHEALVSGRAPRRPTHRRPSTGGQSDPDSMHFHRPSHISIQRSHHARSRPARPRPQVPRPQVPRHAHGPAHRPRRHERPRRRARRRRPARRPRRARRGPLRHLLRRRRPGRHRLHLRQGQHPPPRATASSASR